MSPFLKGDGEARGIFNLTPTPLLSERGFFMFEK